jgi:hypothetical protein
VPPAVEWLRQKVVEEPLFNENATHQALSRDNRARHEEDVDGDAIFEFALHDPKADSAPWVAAQLAAWREAGDVTRIARFDTALRSRRGGRTSRAQLREVVSRDQGIFENMIKVVESGSAPKAAVYTIVSAHNVGAAVAKKVYRLYLPLFSVACALDWPKLRLFNDLRVMAGRL